MKTRILQAFFTLFTCFNVQIFAQTLDRSIFTTNGNVNATVQSGNTLYVGGSFSQLGYGVKKLARYGPGSTKPDFNFPQLDNSSTLYAIEPDGNGGYYLGGNIYSYNGTKFNQGGSSVAGVIHILADYSLDGAFTATEVQGYSVQCIKKQGNRLYIGGNFYSVNNINHQSFAALDAATGNLVSWTPDEPDYGSVNSIEASDSLVFLSGSFSAVGGYYSVGFAAIKASTGKYTKFIYPGANPALKIKSHKLYVGGNFTSLGYQAQGITKVNAANAAFDPAFVQTNGYVYAILADGSGGYYIGGTFSQVGNLTRNNLAHILSNGSVDPAFDPDVNTAVWCLASDGTNLYLGGDFTYVNGYANYRTYAAAVSLTTGIATSWDPAPDNTVRTMVFSGGNVYMGGYFTNVKATGRNYAAAVTTANTLTNWAPNTDGYVNQIIPNATGSSFFICGSFANVKGATHPYVAKVNNTNGNPSAWNPSPNGFVNSIALNGSRIYLGGSFNNINGQYKAYLAEVDTSSNNPTSFQADANNVIYNLHITGGKLYAGGAFTQIQNVNQNYCAKIDLTSKTVDAWNPGLNSYVFYVASAGSNIILGGYLSQVNGADRNRIAAIDLATNQLTSFNPVVTSFGGTVSTMYFSGNELFAGGGISYYNDNYTATFYGIIAFDTLSGIVTRKFDYTPAGTVYGLTVSNNKLFTGGSISTFYDSLSGNPVTRSYLASYDLNNNTLTNDVYDPNNTVRSLSTDASGGVVVVGDFTLTSAVNRQYLAAINLNNGQATAWSPIIDGQVRALAIKDTSLFIGGYFYGIYNSDYTVYTSRKFLGAVSTNTGLATAWNADADNYVETLALADTILYVGGSFTTVKSAARNYAAAIGTGGTGSVKNWAPNTNSYVFAIQPSGGNVYLGGYFTTVKGSSRNYLALVNNTNGNLTAWNPNPNSYIYGLSANATTLYVGGDFTNISGANRNSAVAYNIASNALNPFNPRITNTDGYTPRILSLANFGKHLFVGSEGNYYSKMDSIKGSPRQILGAADTTNGNATAFNPRPDNTISTLKVAGNKLIIGGLYTSLGISASSAYLNVFNLEPLTQASALNFSSLQPTSVTANWTNGSGEGRIVIVREGNTAGTPNDGIGYTANAAYGQGSNIGASYVVYKNSGSSINVTNLRPNKTYYFAVYEYNGGGIATEYLQSPSLTGNITTPCPTYTNIVTASGPTTFCQGDSVRLTAIANMTTYAWSTGATTRSIVVKTAGSYTVSITDSNGCNGVSSPVAVTVNANPTPVITASGSTTNVCPGKTVTLDAGAGYTSYLWSTGATTRTIVVSAAGSYSVTVTNANGCSGTSAPTVVTYQGCPKPTNPVNSNITATSARLSWTPPASCAIGYQLQYRQVSTTAWTTLQFAASSRNITGLLPNTTYEWRVQTGCQQTPPIGSGNISGPNFTTLSAAIAGAGMKQSTGGGLKAILYPNPARDIATIQLSGVTGSVTIRVTDMTGKTVWQSPASTARQVLVPVAQLSRGNYLVTVIGAAESTVLKLVKE